MAPAEPEITFSCPEDNIELIPTELVSNYVTLIRREIIAHRPAERRGYITYDRYLPQLRILSGGQVLALRLFARASRRENSKERREVVLISSMNFPKRSVGPSS